MKSCFFSLFTIGVLCLSSNRSQSQTIDNKKFNAGFDPRQAFYIGMDYRFNSYSIGADLGTSFGVGYPSAYYSLSLDNNFYFGKPNASGYKTWHVNGRIIYSQLLEKESNKASLISFVPAIGKEFNFNQRCGINLDLGVNFMLLNKDSSDVLLGGTGTYYEFSNKPTLSVRLEFFYRY